MRHQLSTGLVLLSGYAIKLRRTMFAQLKDRIKAGEISNKQVAYRVGILNKLLYEILVNQLKLDKHDVVRIRIEYDIENGDIVWDYDSIQIEIYKRNDELSSKAVEEFKKLTQQEVFMREAGYMLEKVGETDLGETIYKIKAGEETVGAIKAVKLNNEVLVTGAIINPPRRIKAVLPANTKDIDSFLENALPSITAHGEEIPENEAEKIISTLLG